MKKKYSFLKDSLALMEIRKHKWIESEKYKKEIGFATAAVDWVKNYGNTWKLARLGTSNDIDVFVEKRRYRRFSVNFPIEIMFNDIVIKTSSTNISLLGLCCETRLCLKDVSSLEIRINFSNQRSKTSHLFKAQTLRSSKKNMSRGETIYKNVILFDEHLRDVLREHCTSFVSETVTV